MRSSAMVSATLAPIALIGGWTWAAVRQSSGYSPTRDTISALAAHGATDRWIMTTGLAVLGACHLITAHGLSEARLAGRVVLMVGGLATLAVAALPQPSAGHVPAATLGFVTLAVWPALSDVPARRTGWAAATILVLLLGWLTTETDHGQLLGLSERAVAGAQALWPLAVVLTLRYRERR